MSIVLDCPTKGAMRFRCAQAGCPACLDALLREHSGLVYWMVMHQAGRKTAYADLLQAGRIGLWRAILHYEAFSSYACVVIRHQVWQLLKQEQKAEGWLEADGREDSLERVIRVWQQEQIRQALGDEMEVLPERLRQVLELHYGLSGAEPQNLAQIGRGWGLTRERIRQLHEQALCLLCLLCRSAYAVYVNEGNAATTGIVCINSNADNGQYGGGDEQHLDPCRSTTDGLAGCLSSLWISATLEPCAPGCRSLPARSRMPFAVAIFCGDLWLG